jgi:hypothetical protein
METNLPELCRRVWARVPECKVAGVVFTHTEIVWPNWMPKHMQIDAIQAAALRWLLANRCEVLKFDTGPYMVWPAFGWPRWELQDTDLTTCLLLAVERCQEYKENSNGN